MDIKAFDGVILKVGSKAPAKISMVQDRQRELGYGGPGNGIFDAQTESVVKLSRLSTMLTVGCLSRSMARSVSIPGPRCSAWCRQSSSR